MTGYWEKKKKHVEINWSLFPEDGATHGNICFVYHDKNDDEKAAIKILTLHKGNIQTRTVWYCDVTDQIYDSRHDAMDACCCLLGD